jgi:hypothetical protein
LTLGWLPDLQAADLFDLLSEESQEDGLLDDLDVLDRPPDLQAANLSEGPDSDRLLIEETQAGDSLGGLDLEED